MLMTPLCSRATVPLTVLTFLFIGTVTAQDKPARPPGAQKSKSPSKSNPAPASSPTGEPGKIVPPPPESAPVPASSTGDSQDPASQRGRIRVNVNLVNVLVSVLDEKNRPALDLPRAAFRLFEEGVEQKIDKFESETLQPLDLAIMIDASLSAHKEITFEQEAAAHFIRQVLRPGDRLSVFCFDENVTQVAPFSDNVADLQSAVRRIPAGAGTSIYDAVVLGSRALERRGDDRRRVIILVTDAGETTSRADFDAARKEAVLSNALLYTIVIRPVKNESGRNTAGEHALETMTDTTGGAMFYPDTPQELGAIFDRIDRELRTQYLLAYYPTPRGPANTYRSIVVTVDPASYHVRHRKSYLTGPQ